MNYLTRLFIFLLIVIALPSCKPQTPKEAVSLPVQEVTVYDLTPQSEVSFEEVLGSVNTGLKSTIEAKINGKIERLFVAPGSLVTSGQVLAELDIREVQARLDQALAVRDQATRDIKRYSTLIGNQAIPQQEFDAAQTRLRVADALVSEAQTMLGYGQVTAPFSGIVTKKLTDIGDLAVPGKPLLEIEDPSALQIHVNVPESLIQYLSLSQTLISNIQSFRIPGKVIEIAPTVDINSRTFLVKLHIPPTPGLRSGQLAKTEIPTGNRNVMIIPAQSLLKRGQMEIVFVADSGTAILKIVKSGRILSNQIEILSGLQEHDKVIVRNSDKLVDRQPIRID